GTAGTSGTSGTMSGTAGTSGTSGTMSGTAGSGMSGGNFSGTLTAISSSTDSALIAVNGNRFMMPRINMFIGNGSFTGYTGCNNIVGTMKAEGSQLTFGDAVPVANLQCIGGFDQSAFMDRLRRADSYEVANNQLRLKQGGQVLMVFEKSGM
ncbi:MAG: META domain-containing protein, partial [Segetibacter sp.]|nr:META domain-containing protein [Segetibacter sp.]